jgi:hypothetical protein|tara:strand:- start:434 stop:601 length:168 start_codon:yes stop_codon:yes gene_type:complete
MKNKIKQMQLIIISRKIKPKKKVRLNRYIEKEHPEKEKEENYMINENFINSRFCK